MSFKWDNFEFEENITNLREKCINIFPNGLDIKELHWQHQFLIKRDSNQHLENAWKLFYFKFFKQNTFHIQHNKGDVTDTGCWNTHTQREQLISDIKHSFSRAPGVEIWLWLLLSDAILRESPSDEREKRRRRGRDDTGAWRNVFPWRRLRINWPVGGGQK